MRLLERFSSYTLSCLQIQSDSSVQWGRLGYSKSAVWFKTVWVVDFFFLIPQSRLSLVVPLSSSAAVWTQRWYLYFQLFLRRVGGYFWYPGKSPPTRTSAETLRRNGSNENRSTLPPTTALLLLTQPRLDSNTMHSWKSATPVISECVSGTRARARTHTNTQEAWDREREGALLYPSTKARTTGWKIKAQFAFSLS